MTVVAAYLYRDGHRIRPVSIDEKVDCRDDKSEFVWIGIADPTEEEMHNLANCYDLHPLAVEDAIKADQLPKIDIYDDQLFVVARTAHLMEDHIDYGETAIFVGHSHIISVRHGSTRAHTALREQLEKSPRLLMHGVDYLLHAILDYIVDGYLPLIEDLEEEVLEMEEQGRRQLPRPRRGQPHLHRPPRADPVPAGARPDGRGGAASWRGRNCPASMPRRAPISATCRTMSAGSRRGSTACAKC